MHVDLESTFISYKSNTCPNYQMPYDIITELSSGVQTPSSDGVSPSNATLRHVLLNFCLTKRKYNQAEPPIISPPTLVFVANLLFLANK